MKKLFPIFAAFVLVVALVGCSSPSFGLTVNNDGTATIKAENEASGTAVSQIEVPEGKGIVMTPKVEKGTVKVTISTADGKTLYDNPVAGANPIQVPGAQGTCKLQAEGTAATGTVEIGFYDTPQQNQSNANGSGSDAGNAGKQDAATANSIVSGKTWQYKYAPGKDDSDTAAAAMTAICDELCKLSSENYEMADVMIPAVDLAQSYDQEDSTVKDFGVFEIYNYKIDGTKLVMQSGGRYVGCMTLALNGDAYEVTKAEYASDGSNMQSSLEEICKGYDGLADSLMQDTAVPEQTRAAFIKNYVDTYGLDITEYEDTDGTVTKL